MGRSGRYKLRWREPIPCEDLLEWARWFETANRHVAQTMVGTVRVSTVFLGLDHNWKDSGDPILFETMIFGGPHDGYQERYSHWEEAECGHWQAVQLARQSRIQAWLDRMWDGLVRLIGRWIP